MVTNIISENVFQELLSLYSTRLLSIKADFAIDCRDVWTPSYPLPRPHLHLYTIHNGTMFYFALMFYMQNANTNSREI